VSHPEPPLTPERAAILRSLRLDATAAQTVRSFRHAGIPSILLKGPALSRWLYDEGALRPYVDCDLLVPPAGFARAEQVLATMGFERYGMDTIPGDWPKHASTWIRPNGDTIDLHRTLVGVEVQPAEAWDVWWDETEPMRVAGVDVDVLRPPARALLIALQAAKDGGRVGKVRHDLGHAVERLPKHLWQEAAVIAARLRATGALGTGLRWFPQGAQIASELELSTERTVPIVLREHGAPPPLAVGMDWFFSGNARGIRGRAELVVRKLFPPPAFLRAWSSLARRGRVGLMLAYAWRPLWVLWHAGPAFRAWRRARRKAGPGDTAGPDPHGPVPQ
jgi:hypothetical protein